MPLWRSHRHNTSEWSDSNTSHLVFANLNDYDQKKSFEIDGRQHPYIMHERPKTAHGAIPHSRHQEIIIPGLGPDHDYTYISSMSSSSASASTSDLPTTTNTDSIGVALGSPSASPCISVVRRSQLDAFGYPPIQHNSSPKPQPSPMLRAHTAHPTSPEQIQTKQLPPPPEPSPKLKRWPTVSGLLKRVKTQKHKREPSVKRPSTSAGHGETWHSRSRSVKSLKARCPTPTKTESEVAWEQISKKSPWLRSGKVLRSEAAKPAPLEHHLDIAIPDAGMDRYSVMFSSVLQGSSKPSTAESSAPINSFPVKETILTRRQNGKEHLTITSPTYIPPDVTVSQLKRAPSVRGRKPPKKSLSLFPALSPLPDTPAYPKEPTNNALRRSKSATALLTTPTKDTFLEPASPSPKRAKSERMPHTPPLDAYFRHFPMPAGKDNSPATFAESWEQTPAASISVPDLSHTADNSFLSDVSKDKTQHTDSPAINIYNWEDDGGDVTASKNIYSPAAVSSAFSGPSTSDSPQSTFLTADASPQSGSLTAPSPRRWHGYDTPHSPLVEMARTICVTNVQNARASIVTSASSSARTSVQLVEGHAVQSAQAAQATRAVPKKLDISKKRSVFATTGKGSVSALGTANRTPQVVGPAGQEEVPRRRSMSVEVEDVEGVWREVETAWGVRESRIGLGVLM